MTQEVMNEEDIKVSRQKYINEILASKDIDDEKKNSIIANFNFQNELMDFLYDASIMIKMDPDGKINNKLKELCKQRIPQLVSIHVIIILNRIKKAWYPLGEFHTTYRMVEEFSVKDNLRYTQLQLEYDRIKNIR